VDRFRQRIGADNQIRVKIQALDPSYGVPFILYLGGADLSYSKRASAGTAAMDWDTVKRTLFVSEVLSLSYTESLSGLFYDAASVSDCTAGVTTMRLAHFTGTALSCNL
jgi:hypothetical protein